MQRIEEREKAFRREVYDLGGSTYTKLMLDNFTLYWSEPDRAPGIRQKMKYEKEKTWSVKRRLDKWATNNFDGIVCYLTESQKTVQQKKKAFAESLQPFLKEYDKEVLNEFYAWWTTPENKPKPEFIRYEHEKYWDVATRLKQWNQRKMNQAVNPMLR